MLSPKNKPTQKHEQQRKIKIQNETNSKNKVPTLFLGPSRPQRKLFMGAGANEAEEERKGIPGNQTK